MLQAVKQKLLDTSKTVAELKSTLEHLMNPEKPILMLSETAFNNVMKSIADTIEGLEAAIQCCDVHSGVRDFRLMIPLEPKVRQEALRHLRLKNVFGCGQPMPKWEELESLKQAIEDGDQAISNPICSYYGRDYCQGCPFYSRFRIHYACIRMAARLSRTVKHYFDELKIRWDEHVWVFRGMECHEIDKFLRVMRHIIRHYTYDAPEHRRLKVER